MYPECLSCDLRFEREQGYFVGAIYINYAATVSIMIAGYFLLEYAVKPPLGAQLLIWSAFGIAFPVVFFRYSRSLWLSLDYIFSPEDVPEPPRNTRES